MDNPDPLQIRPAEVCGLKLQHMGTTRLKVIQEVKGPGYTSSLQLEAEGTQAVKQALGWVEQAKDKNRRQWWQIHLSTLVHWVATLVPWLRSSLVEDD